MMFCYDHKIIKRYVDRIGSEEYNEKIYNLRGNKIQLIQVIEKLSDQIEINTKNKEIVELELEIKYLGKELKDLERRREEEKNQLMNVFEEIITVFGKWEESEENHRKCKIIDAIKLFLNNFSCSTSK